MPDEIYVVQLRPRQRGNYILKQANPSEEIGATCYIRSDKGIPAGWKLVPIEPTERMTMAAIESFEACGKFALVSHYKAMIDAAPDYEEGK